MNKHKALNNNSVVAPKLVGSMTTVFVEASEFNDFVRINLDPFVSGLIPVNVP